MKIVALLAALLILGGCSSIFPEKIVYVNKVVREPCIDPAKVPKKPVYRYGKGVKPAERERGLMLIKDFEAAEQYGNDWEGAATGCIMFVP